jgi:ribonuclease P protein component
MDLSWLHLGFSDVRIQISMPPTPSKPFTFRKAEHLRRPADFRRVYDRQCSLSDGWLIIYARENGLAHLRLGLSVARKFGNAPHRNRLRRLFREAFRLTKHDLPPGLDLVLIPRRAAEPTLADLQRSLKHLVTQLSRRLVREAKKS